MEKAKDITVYSSENALFRMTQLIVDSGREHIEPLSPFVISKSLNSGHVPTRIVRRQSNRSYALRRTIFELANVVASITSPCILQGNQNGSKNMVSVIRY